MMVTCWRHGSMSLDSVMSPQVDDNHVLLQRCSSLHLLHVLHVIDDHHFLLHMCSSLHMLHVLNVAEIGATTQVDDSLISGPKTQAITWAVRTSANQCQTWQQGPLW